MVVARHITSDNSFQQINNDGFLKPKVETDNCNGYKAIMRPEKEDSKYIFFAIGNEYASSSNSGKWSISYDLETLINKYGAAIRVESPTKMEDICRGKRFSVNGSKGKQTYKVLRKIREKYPKHTIEVIVNKAVPLADALNITQTDSEEIKRAEEQYEEFKEEFPSMPPIYSEKADDSIPKFFGMVAIAHKDFGFKLVKRLTKKRFYITDKDGKKVAYLTLPKNTGQWTMTLIRADESKVSKPISDLSEQELKSHLSCLM